MDLYDFLGLRCKCATRLEQYLWQPFKAQPCPLTEAAARLLNAIASTERGRQYIGKYSIVQVLMWDEPQQANRPKSCAGMGRIGDTAAAHLMATIMKLAFEQRQRIDMVHKGVMMWLVHHLASIKYALMQLPPNGMQPKKKPPENAKSTPAQRIAAYHINSATAVLMQLMAEWPGMRIMWDDMRETLGLLGGFLHSDVTACRANVRAVLMAMMSNSRSAAMARTLQFDKFMSRHLAECVTDKKERKECEMIVRAILRLQTVYEDHPHLCKADVSAICIIY